MIGARQRNRPTYTHEVPAHGETISARTERERRIQRGGYWALFNLAEYYGWTAARCRARSFDCGVTVAADRKARIAAARFYLGQARAMRLRAAPVKLGGAR